MKFLKIILFLVIVLFSSMTIKAQKPVSIQIEVDNISTAFGKILPEGSYVYLLDSSAIYRLGAKFTATQTMSNVLTSGDYIKLTGGSSFNLETFEKELSESENNIDVGFVLQSTSLVFFNGAKISDSEWSGEGTNTLNLNLPTKLYDNLTVRK